MHDDSWRDSYDAWKLASPYDDYDEPPECPHDDYEIDIISGRAECQLCDYSWWASDAEIDEQILRNAEYQEWAEREYRRERWLRLTHWARRPVQWLLERLRPRKAMNDDDIPF